MSYPLLSSTTTMRSRLVSLKVHMVFDIKLNLVRKARLVADGHLTKEMSKEEVYSSVVSRDSICIAFLLAALNDLKVLLADVQNAYLQSKTGERQWTCAGLEFGPENVGRPVKIVQALYGLRSSGKCWRETLAQSLREAGFSSCKADNDVWMRAAIKPDGEKYYEYVLVYVDDILAISTNPKAVMDYLETTYTLKENSVQEPTEYLGTQIKKVSFKDGTSEECWAMSSDNYVKLAVTKVERELLEVGDLLKTGRISTPLAVGYRPELDVTNELDAKRANYFQGLIGVLRWICELGRVDIVEPVSKMSSHLMTPCRNRCFIFLLI